MDLTTKDERAWALAPALHVTLIGRDFTVWVNPVTGTSCRVEATGDYQVSRVVGLVPKPVVLGQVPVADAVAMITDPHAESTLRAVAHAIVGVDQAAGQWQREAQEHPRG